MARFKCEDMEVYNELRMALREDEQQVLDTVALGVFTQAYAALRRSLHEQSKSLPATDLEEFA
ncbi:MAG: hypothetical protein ACPL0A_03375, partial [Candidatus Micrarchaeia archaeon]